MKTKGRVGHARLEGGQAPASGGRDFLKATSALRARERAVKRQMGSAPLSTAPSPWGSPFHQLRTRTEQVLARPAPTACTLREDDLRARFHGRHYASSPGSMTQHYGHLGSRPLSYRQDKRPLLAIPTALLAQIKGTWALTWGFDGAFGTQRER